MGAQGSLSKLKPLKRKIKDMLIDLLEFFSCEDKAE